MVHSLHRPPADTVPSLEALNTFIEQQKALLARTQSDIETLRQLKSETIADPASLADQLSGRAFRLSEQDDCESKVPEGIDWTLFAHKDPKPLQDLALAARAAYAARNKPSRKQHSELSDLQKLVKAARRTIIDPVLRDEQGNDDDPNATPQPNVTDPPRKAQHPDSAPTCRTTLAPRGPSGLFTRRAPPVDDLASAASSTVVDSEISTAATTSPRCNTPPPGAPPVPMALAKPVRTRRISTKLQRQNEDRSEAAQPPRPRRKASAARAVVKTEPDLDHEPEPKAEPEAPLPPEEDTNRPPPKVLGKRTRKDKEKPDNYKVLWSASEQNLLERLLEEIPASDPRRFLNISLAMNGRRTPRQVSSRVQKYLQKLKKYGVEGK
ncbi:hypothetical protein GGX14DRAFT_465796 [Mycena pura]|uniref:Myb-like domain-containing protein n=1 Tax=Mycena pura TaxID=153505 RepID=A0AAD6V558_9AGAR|nr:hypothetical protein GGX14DRAFT_465796 [Mycena pura]